MLTPAIAYLIDIDTDLFALQKKDYPYQLLWTCRSIVLKQSLAYNQTMVSELSKNTLFNDEVNLKMIIYYLCNDKYSTHFYI